MRHLKDMRKRGRCRRGISFVEIISSIIIIGIISGAIIRTGTTMLTATKEAANYTRLRVFATDTIERIQDDLESGVTVDTPGRYSQADPSSDLRADVSVVSVGDAYGKEVYLVKMSLLIKDTNVFASPTAIVREGCTIYADS